VTADDRYDVSGLPEAQFEPGSNDQALKNRLGIISKPEMDAAEARALEQAMDVTEHPRGQHKACLFKSALGWTAESAEKIRRRLLEAVLREDALFLDADDYGQRYALDFPVQDLGGVATVRSLWMIRAGEDFPRLVTCYVL